MNKSSLALPYYPSNSNIWMRISMRVSRNKLKYGFKSTWWKTPFNHIEKRKKIRLRAFKNIQPDLKCVRCGCSDIRFLEINHKFGGGCKELKTKGIGSFSLVFEIAQGRRKTDDLELLCRPCNHIHFLEMKFGEKIPLRVIYEKEIKLE